MNGPRRYEAEVIWDRQGASDDDFRRGRYARGHVFRFDGGLEVPASASPQHVPPEFADARAVDPEEAFIAALSSCHMLFFLAYAARDGYVVARYADAAFGLLGREPGARRESMTQVTLRPAATFAGDRRPTRADIERLHHASHDACYIANSVRTEVRIEPVLD